tara:strand:+ start:548 stop:2539 length:1992 start_codon:yes stop_codon:yes gene_type:complete
VGCAEHAFIGALDGSISKALLARGLPTMRVGLNGSTAVALDDAAGGSDGAADEGGNFRLVFSKFRAYGVTKAVLIAWLLRAKRHVVVSDVDCAWLAPPQYLLKELPEADVMAGTDCLHVLSDDDRSERTHAEPRCGHHPGSRWAAWFNTGVLVFRATAAAIDFAEQWRDRMAEVHGDGSWGNQVDDQLTFNQLIEFKGRVGDQKAGTVYPVKAARPDGRVIWDAGQRRRIAPLPARRICSGHVFHIQQGIERRDCLVMHLTFVEADRAGKRWRLREAGLFPLRPEPVGGGRRFVTYTAPLPRGPVPPERDPSLYHGGRVLPIPDKTRWPVDEGRGVLEGWSVQTALRYAPRLAAHMELVDRHIFAMKQALAVARVLGRELIMPRLLCLCERGQSPFDVLPNCVKLGTTTELPFVCPMENFLNVEELEGLWASAEDGFVQTWGNTERGRPGARSSPYVVLRPWTLLNATFHPAAAAALVRSATTTQVQWYDPTALGAAAAVEAAGAAGVAGVGAGAGAGAEAAGAEVAASSLPMRVPYGLTDGQLRSALGGIAAPLLHLGALEGPAFGGWEEKRDGDEFEEEVRKWVIPGESRFSGTWCCTHTHYQAGTLLYKNPARFPSSVKYQPGYGAGPPQLEQLRALHPERRKRECYWDDCRPHAGVKIK